MSSMNKKPVIVVATGIMNAGGTESLIMETFRNASDRIKYILLIHEDDPTRKGVFDDEIEKIGIEKYYIGSVGKLGVNGYIQAFKDFSDTVGHIDIVHSHLNGIGGIISLAAKKAKIQHRICHCHADIRFRGSNISKIKNEITLQGMKFFIEGYATDRWACSVPAWKRLFYPWHKKVIIDNMIDTQCYLATAAKRSKAKDKFGLTGQFIIGAVGRVAPIKNYECILKALVGLDAHFVCFGRFNLSDGYCKSLDNLAKNLGVSDRVHWLGNSNEISSDIHCIDLFVMPSITEGFGMAAIEAQAASIPSILSTGVPKIVDTGLGLVKFLNPSNPDEWHNEFSNRLADRNSFKILPADRILNNFTKKHFDSPSAVKEIENRYIELTEE